MSEWRQDDLTGRQVLMAPDRTDRPHDVAVPGNGTEIEATDTSPRADCPFCKGNEAQTPDAVYQWPANSTDWLARVVPNKYPIVAPLAADITGGSDESITRGLHEVIIETPRHCGWMSQLSRDESHQNRDEWYGLVTAWQHRIFACEQEHQFPLTALFKNVGYAGGASLVHLHSQIVGLTQLPKYIQRQRERLQQRYAETGQSVMSQVIAEELESDRLVYSDDNWIVYCPYASRQSYEMVLAPRAHASSFALALQKEPMRKSFAQVLRRVMVGLERALPGAGYNLLLNTEPTDPALHWRLEIVPRTAAFAGFELLSGVYVCTVDPAVAAGVLRGVI